MKRLCLLFILFAPFIGVSQSDLPDSIHAQLLDSKLDTVQFDKLNEYASSLIKENPEKARNVLNQLLENKNIDYPRGKARSLTLLGNSYWSEGIYEYALRNYLLSVRAYEEVVDSIGVGRTYNNIGEVYKKIGNYDKSLEYLLLSLSLKKNKGPISLYNIGEVYLFKKDYKMAGEYFQQSLEMAIDMKDNIAIAYCYWGIGKTEVAEKNYDHALSLFEQSLNAWETTGESRSIIQLNQEIARVYVQQKKFTEAHQFLLKATSLATQFTVPDLELNNRYIAYSIDSSQGNTQAALYHFYRYSQLKDSVFNLQKTEQINRLQTIYETEKRDRENEELRHEQTFKNSQLKTQRIILIAVSISLLITMVMAFFLFRQRKLILYANKELTDKNEKISNQHEAIQDQANELKTLNEALLDLNKNLENRIQERTQQLHFQNQKLKEYTFVNVHKLRAPLASILGLINLMNQLPANEVPQAIHYLKNCSEHLDDIIRDFNIDLESGIMDKET